MTTYEELTEEARKKAQEANKLYNDTRREYRHRYYETHKEKWKSHKEYDRRYYATRSAFLANEKASRGCLRCGERDPVVLDFHHRDRSEKRFLVSMARRMSLEALKEEIARCDVLCANCHRRVEYEKRHAS